MSILEQFANQLGPASNIPASGAPVAVGRIAADLQQWSGIDETSSAALPLLTQYWDTVGLDEWSPSGTPWSAAWVSHTLRGTGFPAQAAHWKYAESIIGNRPDNWQAYSVPDNIGRLSISPGDVLIRPRSGDFYSTHGDIVYRLSNDTAELVGGNLSNRVKISARLPVDNTGRLLDAGDYLVILKKKRSSPLPWIAGLGLVGFLIWRAR